MLGTIASLGLGLAADKVLGQAAKAVLPVAKTAGEKVIQKAGCIAISMGVGYAIDQWINDTAKGLKKATDAVVYGIEVVKEDEAE